MNYLFFFSLEKDDILKVYLYVQVAKTAGVKNF